jgi:hypothetical protein
MMTRRASSSLSRRPKPYNEDLDDYHLLPERTRNILVMVLAEFCATFMFLMMSFIGTQAALNSNQPGSSDTTLRPFTLMYIASCFGCALATNVWIFYRVSGGMFNPAVSRKASPFAIQVTQSGDLLYFFLLYTSLFSLLFQEVTGWVGGMSMLGC